MALQLVNIAVIVSCSPGQVPVIRYSGLLLAEGRSVANVSLTASEAAELMAEEDFQSLQGCLSIIKGSL